ncbi:MAG: site-2 protease family protein [Candidatus Gastranaerophilales bacterium]|nr:site-2 protease family protein [Candidatus Gastranaerophilales bacterium]
MNQIVMILLISALVLVHEIGHFIAARMCNVRVTRFGIGMPLGPSWKLFKWNNTNFYLHAFLFGGYVAFPDDNMEKNPEDDVIEVPEQKEGETFFEKIKRIHLEKRKKEQEALLKEYKEEQLPSDSPELYENKTIGQKLFIVSAGVIMNVIFAVVLVIFCAIYYHKLPASAQNIYINSPDDKITSNITQYDIRKKDKFVSINNMEIKSLYQLTFFVKNSKLFDSYAQEDLVEYNLAELKKLNTGIQDIIPSDTLLLLPQTKPEKPLEVNKNVVIGLEKYRQDGVKLFDNQIKLRDEVYNKKVYKTSSEINLNDLAYALSDTYKPLEIKLLRGDKEIILKDIKVGKEGLLGVQLMIADLYTETKTFKDIIFKSCDYLYSTTTMMLFSLWQLITGKISVSDMHGVIAIVKVGGDIIASKGMLNGILLTAMISINLAIMNFLPIPALDGGHVLFLMIEKITGKKPTRELGEKINNVFFILLILLMVAICYNDVLALVTKKL